MRRVLISVPESAFTPLRDAFTVRYSEDIEVVSDNAQAYNVLMREHDRLRPDTIVFYPAMPGTTDPTKTKSKTLTEMIEHVRMVNPRVKLMMLPMDMLIKEKERAALRLRRISLLDGEPVDPDLLAASLGAKTAAAFEHPVLSAYSLKGGIGKSSVAANLAIRLMDAYDPPYDRYSGLLQRPSTGMRVLIWDMDFQSSDMRMLFNVPEKMSLFDMLLAAKTRSSETEAPRLSLDLITEFIYRDPATGVDILAAPAHNARVANFDDEERAMPAVTKLLGALKNIYHVIIFDNPNEILARPNVEAAIRRSSRVIHVTKPSRRAITVAKQGMFWLTKLGMDERSVLVLNAVSDPNIDTGQMERSLGSRFVSHLPEIKDFDMRQDDGDFPVAFSRQYRDGIDDIIAATMPLFMLRPDAKKRPSKPLAGKRAGSGEAVQKQDADAKPTAVAGKPEKAPKKPFSIFGGKGGKGGK